MTIEEILKEKLKEKNSFSPLNRVTASLLHSFEKEKEVDLLAFEFEQNDVDKYKLFLSQEVQKVFSTTHPEDLRERLTKLIIRHCKTLTALGWRPFHYPIDLTSRLLEQTKELINVFDELYQKQHLLYTYGYGLGKINYLGMYTEFVNAVLRDMPVSNLGRERHELAIDKYEESLKNAKEFLGRKEGKGISKACQNYLYHYNDYLLCKAETILNRDYDSNSVQEVLMGLSESYQELKRYALDAHRDYAEQMERFSKITGRLLKLRPNSFRFNFQTMSEFVVKNAIEDLKSEATDSNIKLMDSLDLFGDLLKHLSGREDWKELLRKFYFVVAEKDEVLKHICSSKSVKEAFGLIDAWYEKQIESKSAEIFKITDEEKRKDKLTQLLRHPPIGSYIGFLGGLKLTSVERVDEVHQVLSGFCDEALHKLLKSKGSSEYKGRCISFRAQMYEYTAFSVRIFDKSLRETWLATGAAYRKRCDFIITAYLDYCRKLEETLKELEDGSMNPSVMASKRYFLFNAENYILDNNCLNADVIQRVLSEFLNLGLSNKNIYTSKDYEIFNKLLEHKVKVDNTRQDMGSFIVARAMNFLLSKSNWYGKNPDKNAFELVLKAELLYPMLKTELQIKLKKEIDACEGLKSLEEIEGKIKQSLAQYEESSPRPINLEGHVLELFKKTVVDTINHKKIHLLTEELNSWKNPKSLDEFARSAEEIDRKIILILEQYPEESSLRLIKLDGQVLELESFKKTVLDTIKLTQDTIKRAGELLPTQSLADQVNENAKSVQSSPKGNPEKNKASQVDETKEEKTGLFSKINNFIKRKFKKSETSKSQSVSKTSPTSSEKSTQREPNKPSFVAQVNKNAVGWFKSAQSLFKSNPTSEGLKFDETQKEKKGLFSRIARFFKPESKKSEKNILISKPQDMETQLLQDSLRKQTQKAIDDAKSKIDFSLHKECTEIRTSLMIGIKTLSNEPGKQKSQSVVDSSNEVARTDNQQSKWNTSEKQKKSSQFFNEEEYLECLSKAPSTDSLKKRSQDTSKTEKAACYGS